MLGKSRSADPVILNFYPDAATPLINSSELHQMNHHTTMATPNPNNPAIDFAVATAKADVALALTQQFQREINNLRDALETANRENHFLKTQNAKLKARLDRLEDGDAEGEDEVDVDEPDTDICRPPPEGTIFSNGGPYKPSKNDRNDTQQLKQELNQYTQARGYSVKIMRSKLTGARVKLVVVCVLAGRPHLMNEKQRQEKVIQGLRVNKPRTSKLLECPLRFLLQEIVQDSGTFVVQHTGVGSHMRCNHEPDPIPEPAAAATVAAAAAPMEV